MGGNGRVKRLNGVLNGVSWLEVTHDSPFTRKTSKNNLFQPPKYRPRYIFKTILKPLSCEFLVCLVAAHH